MQGEGSNEEVKEAGMRRKKAGQLREREVDGIVADNMVHRGCQYVMGAAGQQERLANFGVAVLDRTDFSCKQKSNYGTSSEIFNKIMCTQ